MSKFKVGDRVNTEYGVGVVKALPNRQIPFYAVELDTAFWGHECGGLTKKDHGAWTIEEGMSLVKPSKTFKPNTQCGQILAHLASGKTLTRITADHLYRVASLTRRILDLKEAGHKIISTTKVDATGRTYVEYSMRKAGR